MQRYNKNLYGGTKIEWIGEKKIKNMKIMITTILSAAMFCCACNNGVDAKNPVETVDSVDLARYVGHWYEISSYPMWFEKGMTEVSANYTIKDGYVEVLNSGYKKGKLKVAKGKAKIVEGSGGARLKVSFFGPFYAQYWIVDLAGDYSWAVVSNAKRSTLWILSRSSIMDSALYDSIIGRLTAHGFDTTKLVMMKQN